MIDAGAGVPEAERERIFGRFERGGRAGAGFGLGLAIARGLARQMGGDVSAPRGAERRVLRGDAAVCAAPVGAAQDPVELEGSAPAPSGRGTVGAGTRDW